MSGRAETLRLLETNTGTNFGNHDSVSEYLDEIEHKLGLSEQNREFLHQLIQKELFASDVSLTDREKRELVQLCERREPPDTPGTQQSLRQPDSPIDASQADAAATVEPSDSDETHEATGLGSKDQLTASASHSEGTRTPQNDQSRKPSQVKKDSFVWLTKSDIPFIFPTMIFSLYTFFYGLGAYPLRTWDEGFYGNLARHAVQDGYWLAPRMYYQIGLRPSVFEPWLRLPPLGTWLQALSMYVFGVNQFAVRFPSAAASVLTVLLVYFAGRHFGSRRSGFVGSLIYLTTPYVNSGFNAGRDGGLDPMLVLFGSLFVFTTWLAVKHDNPRWLYLMGFFGGLAVLVKGFGAGVFLLVVLPLVFIKQHIFVSKEMAAATGLTALITLPWPIYMYSLYDELFVQRFFVRYIFERAAGGAFGTNTNTVFAFMDYPYFKEILFAPNLFHPWSIILILTLPLMAYREFESDAGESSSETGFLIWWLLVSFGLFVFIGSKVWYILPMYVPAAVLLGREIDAAFSGREPTAMAISAGAVLVLILSPEYSIYPASSESLNKGVVVAFGAVFVTLALPLNERLVTSLPRRLYATLSRVAPFIVAVILVGALIGVPSTSGGSVEQKAIADELNTHAPSSATIFIDNGLGVPLHTFSFYTQRPLESGTVADFQSSDIRYAVLPANAVSRVQPEPTVLMNTTVESGRNVVLIEVDR